MYVSHVPTTAEKLRNSYPHRGYLILCAKGQKYSKKEAKGSKIMKIKKSFINQVSLILLIIFSLCSCASVSTKRLESINKSLMNQDYDEAFDTCFLTLSEDIKNKDAIVLFPDIFDKVYGYHFDMIKNMQSSEDWDNLTKEYDSIIEINDKVETIKKSMNEKYFVNKDKEVGSYVPSFLKNKFSPTKEEIQKVLDLKLNDVSDKKDLAYNKAANFHYSKGNEYKQEGNFREAVKEFERSVNFITSYKNSEKLIKECTALANQKDALKHYEKGKELANQDRLRDASQEFKESLTFVPDFKDAKLLEKKYVNLANQKDALKHYEKGKELANQDRLRDASQEFKESLTFVPDFKDAKSLEKKYENLANNTDAKEHYDTGMTLMNQNKFQEAQTEFLKANEYIDGFKDALLLAKKCKNAMPSEQQIFVAIAKRLQNEIPVSWVGNLMGGKNAKLSKAQVVKIGIYNENQKYWPMKIQCVGQCILNDPFNPGKVVSFDQIGDFSLYRDDYGEWQAVLKGGMFQ